MPVSALFHSATRPLRLLSLILAAVLTFTVVNAGVILVSMLVGYEEESYLGLWIATALSYFVLTAGLWWGFRLNKTSALVAVSAVVFSALLVFMGDIMALFVLWMFACSIGIGTCL